MSVTVWARERDDQRWHVARETYPSTADTACGRRGVVADLFATSPRDAGFGRPDYCEPCRAAVMRERGR